MYLKKYWFYALTALLLVLFCYFRVKPILLQSFPFTFDQGRDFLKTERIVREHHLAFYGPPAGGVAGLSHGVWWYYALIIPYVLSGGLPQGFSFFIFTVMLISVTAYFWFLQKEFNRLTALLFLMLVTFSPYATFSSFFPINSVMTIPFILGLSCSFYYFIKTRKPVFALLFAMSAGFIFEAEVPFGILLFPSLVATLIVTLNYKKFYASRKTLLYSFIGLAIPFAPRILLELATKFIQTRALVDSMIHSHEPIAKGDNIFLERFHMFKDYFYSIFPVHQMVLSILALILIAAAFYLVTKLKKSPHRSLYSFSFFIPFMLFCASLLSTKRNFWANYLEGIQYFFIILITASFYIFNTSKKRWLQNISYILIALYALLMTVAFITDMRTAKPQKLDGLLRQTKTLDKIYELSGKKNPLCISVYTPPVIPHTYNYLYGVYGRQGFAVPTTNYVDHKCYYIMEREDYEFRVVEWRKNNIPAGATQLGHVTINPDVTIEVWQEHETAK